MLGKNTVLIVLHLRFQLHARILKNEVTIVRCLPCAVDGGWTFFAFRQLFMKFFTYPTVGGNNGNDYRLSVFFHGHGHFFAVSRLQWQ